MPLLVLFLVIGLEIWGLLQLIERIGAVPVLAWVVLTAVGGLWLIRRTGLHAVRRIQIATQRGFLPPADVLSDLLVLLAGLLLLTPGLLFDLIGISLIAGQGLRQRLAGRIQSGIARARPELRSPVILEGEYRDLTPEAKHSTAARTAPRRR